MAKRRYSGNMKLILLMMLAIAQPASASPVASTAKDTATPLSELHKRDISCVATFAIVASEQELGTTNAMRYPMLSERGRTYAGLIGERVMAETGQSREQVRDAILASVADQQAKAKAAGEPSEVVETEMTKCLPLLEAALPPKPKPTLNQCAALMQLAYEKVYEEQKLSKMAQDLKTLAYVLDSRAREKMRAEGKSGNESDVVLTLIREEMKAAKAQQGEQPELDTDHCFTLAAPDKKGQNFEH